jgi:hypothetical protein
MYSHVNSLHLTYPISFDTLGAINIQNNTNGVLAANAYMLEKNTYSGSRAIWKITIIRLKFL